MALDTIAVARAEIAQIYIAAFNRVPDAAGLSNWLNQYTAGLMTYAQIAEDFTRQAEYQAKYPSIMTNTEYVTEIYQNVFGRTPDAGGLANWTNQLDHTSITGINRGNIMKLMLDAAGATGNTDGVRLDNQASFAIQSILDGVDTDAATAQLVNITSDAATVTTATAAVAASANLGQTFTLTTGVDTVTGTSGNDTFTAGDIAAAAAWTTGDTINGGNGNDTFTVITAGAIAKPVAATVTNVETMNATAGTTINLNTTTFTGLTTLNTTAEGANADAVTAAATTDVNMTHTLQAGQAISVTGGKNVTVTATGNNATTGDVTVTNAAGTVAVNLTAGYTDANAGASATTILGDVTVTGGSTITVTTATGVTAAQTAAAALLATNDTIAQGVVTVTGNASTTAVTVNQANTVAATAYAAAIAGTSAKVDGVMGVNAGQVVIADVNAASTTAAGTITTVSLNGFGEGAGATVSTITSSALNTLNLSGASNGAGLTVSDGGALTTPAVTTFALNTNGFSTVGAGAGVVTLDTSYTTLNINSSTAASTIKSLVAAGATTVNVSGDAALTLTADTLTAVTAINVTNTAGAKFGTAINTGVTFTGGAGADAVTLTDGFTKAIVMGAGNDTVSIVDTVADGVLAGSVAGVVTGSVAAGDGTDTIKTDSATAAAIDGDSKFNAAFTGFEVLELTNALAAGATIDLDAINSVSKVVLDAGGTSATTSILNNLDSGGTLEIKAASTGVVVGVTSAVSGATDVLNVTLVNSTAAAVAFGSITAANVETINITTSDTGTGADIVAMVDTATLVATSAKSIVVSGNDGLNLTNTGNAAVTSFDASGVVGNTADDIAANLAVTFASENVTTTATVTIKGGAGNDVLTGNAAKDTITGGAGADKVDGGAGIDTINIGSGRDIVTTINNDDATALVVGSGTSGADSINGYTLATAFSGVDLSTDAKFIAETAGGANFSLLNIQTFSDDGVGGNGTAISMAVEANATGAGQAAGVTYTVLNGILTLSGTGAAAVDTMGEWLAEAAAVAANNGETLAFQFGSDSYLFSQAGASDVLIQLVGVTGATSIVEASNSTTVTAGAIVYADL